MPSNNEELDVTQPNNAPESKPKKSAKKDDTKPAKKTKTDAPKAEVKVATVKPDDKTVEQVESPKTDAKVEAKADATASDTAPKVAAVTAVEGDKPAKKPVNYKSIAVKVGAGLVALFALVVIVFGVLIYGYKSDSKVVYAVSGVIPYPVEKVNGSFITYHAYLFEVDANKRAYQNNAKLNNQAAVVFTTADGKKLVVQIKQHSLEKLKEDAVTAQLASKNKVTVSSKEVNDLLNELYTRYGGKATLLKSLKTIYGWNINDLKSVIKKQLLAQKVQDKITADPKVDAQAKAKAQDVVAQLRAGGDFATLAKKYSQASDASNGGDLGSFTRGQVPDEIQKAIDATAVGAVSDPVKTQYGYEVIKVISKDGDTFHVEHILVKTIDYTAYFNDQVSKAKVNVYVKI